MLLPFVREIFADVQKSAPFARLLARLKDQKVPSHDGAGRISVSGLTPTATLLHVALLHGALRKPLSVLVANNRAADEMLPVLRRSEEHTSELQSPCNLVCRLLLEKKKTNILLILKNRIAPCLIIRFTFTSLSVYVAFTNV